MLYKTHKKSSFFLQTPGKSKVDTGKSVYSLVTGLLLFHGSASSLPKTHKATTKNQ